MDELPGSVGTSASFSLRLGQTMFSSASLLFMSLGVEFYSYTAFWYLFLSPFSPPFCSVLAALMLLFPPYIYVIHRSSHLALSLFSSKTGKRIINFFCQGWYWSLSLFSSKTGERVINFMPRMILVDDLFLSKIPLGVDISTYGSGCLILVLSFLYGLAEEN